MVEVLTKTRQQLVHLGNYFFNLGQDVIHRSMANRSLQNDKDRVTTESHSVLHKILWPRLMTSILKFIKSINYILIQPDSKTV